MREEVTMQDLLDEGFKVVHGDASHGYSKLRLQPEDIKEYIEGDINEDILLVKSRLRNTVGPVSSNKIAKDTGIELRIVEEILDNHDWAKFHNSSYWEYQAVPE